MSWDLAQCEDSELIRIADRLNKCRESKIMLDLELCNEEFKLKYIFKRKELTAAKAKTRMNFIIPFSLVEIACIVLFITSIISTKTDGYSTAVVITMFISIVGFFFCGYICIRLWMPQFKMMGKLNPFGKNRDEEKGLVTFDVEKEKAEERISVLKAQIDTVVKEIADLLEKKRRRETVLRAIFVEGQRKNNAEENMPQKNNGLFQLRPDRINNIQKTELTQHYNREIRVQEKELARLKLEDMNLQDKIINIDVEIAKVKDRIIIFVLVVAMLTVLMGFVPGLGKHIIAVVWCVVVICNGLWVINKCKEPIILYMVEHEHKQIQDYAFTHSLTPLYKKRKILARDIADCVRRIDNFENKKQELDEE